MIIRVFNRSVNCMSVVEKLSAGNSKAISHPWREPLQKFRTFTLVPADCQSIDGKKKYEPVAEWVTGA